jgi:hypothetical protein
VVAENVPRRSGLSIEAKLGALMREADSRRIAAAGAGRKTGRRASFNNSESASLTIALYQSHNRAPKFLEFRQNFNCSRRRPPRQSRLPSADLSGTLTAERPGKSDASEVCAAMKRENFPGFSRPRQNVR